MKPKQIIKEFSKIKEYKKKYVYIYIYKYCYLSCMQTKAISRNHERENFIQVMYQTRMRKMSEYSQKIQK